MSKKRDRAHELALAREATKRAKYDAKLKTTQLTTEAKLQDSKAEREARREELQLQIELLKAQAEAARAQNPQGGGGLYHDSFGFSGSSSPADSMLGLDADLSRESDTVQQY